MFGYRRIHPVLCCPFKAMLCYWFTSNAFSLLQVLFLRIPRVRTFFKIPELFNHSQAAPIKQLDVPKLSFMDGFRQSEFHLLAGTKLRNDFKNCVNCFVLYLLFNTRTAVMKVYLSPNNSQPMLKITK